MKDDKKKVNVKKENKEIKAKKGSEELTDEQMSQVTGGDVITLKGTNKAITIGNNGATEGGYSN